MVPVVLLWLKYITTFCGQLMITDLCFFSFLDLSAAFDTVDRSTLLLRLRTRFGVKGSALAWFESYLSSRKYYVQVEGFKSSFRSLDSGVPQGSVLGPLLYVLFTSPVADIIESHDLQYHFYADDTQLYITFKTDSADDMCLAK